LFKKILKWLKLTISKNINNYDFDEYKKSEHEKCCDYFNELFREADLESSSLTRDTVLNSLMVWHRVADHIKNIAIPNICPSENDSILMVWSKDNYYLECEIYADGLREWFYRDRLYHNIYGIDLAYYEQEGDDVYNLLSKFVMKE
jgi:hypothetical protein